MSALYRYTDVDGDRLSVFPADIPGKGEGVNIRTTHDGASIPVSDIPKLILALAQVVGGHAREIG